MKKKKVECGNEMGLCILFRMVCEKYEDDCLLRKNGEEVSAQRLLNETFGELLKDEEMEMCSPLELEGEYVSQSKLCDENALLSEESKKMLMEKLEKVSQKRKVLLGHVTPESPFPYLEDIDEYLEAYYELLVSIFANGREILESGLQKVLQSVLNVDMYLSDGGGFATLYSPMVLDGIKRVYDGLQNYGMLISNIMDAEPGRDYAERKRNYKEVFISKVLRVFRWTLVDGDNLLQAAIPAYVSDDAEVAKFQKTLKIPVRKLADYNSYEGIGELRLLDKVIYELEKRLADSEVRKKKFNIAVFGDINEEPMQVLCQMLDCLIREDRRFEGKREILLNFNIYTYNYQERQEHSEGTSDADIVSYSFFCYKRGFLKTEDMDEVIKQNDIVFLLDMCDLYNALRVEMLEDCNAFLQRILSYSYLFDYKCSGGRNDMICGSRFKDLVQELYGLYYTGKAGRIKKEVNVALLKHLISMEDKEKGKSIYTYISDVQALGSFFWDQDQIIRVERYNEKEIVILRMSSYQDDVLPLKSAGDERIIVFTVWQMVKHVAIRDCRYVVEKFFDPAKGETELLCMLKDILIGVDYANWPEKIGLYYQLPNNVNTGIDERNELKGKVEEYLKEMILPFFQAHSKDMYYEYFLKSMGSFLYSDAKDVSDMLFLHLFLNQHDLLKKAEILCERNDLEQFRPDRCKYSQKKFYEDVMQDYDTSSWEFSYKYIKLAKMEEDGGLRRKEVFENVKKVCEWNHYEDSYLYRNCNVML